MIKKILLLVVMCSYALVLGQDKMTIAWDVSLSMQNRNIDKEFEFLDKYFQKYPNTRARVILFNGIQANERDFTIQNGQWEGVKKELSEAIYDGATGYHTLTKVFLDGTTFLFTDGIENMEEDLPPLGKQLYVINSRVKNNLKNLQFLALSNKGRFVNLKPPGATVKEELINGFIHGLDVPLEAVTIRVKDSKKKTRPNEDGSFQIMAVPGDIVVIEVAGIDPVEKLVSQNEELNVWLEYEGIELGEVMLEKKKEEEESSEEINTGIGKQKKRNVGYGITTLESEDFNAAATTISEALQGKLPGVRGTNIETSLIRGQTTLVGNNFPLIILDDVPLPIGQSTDFISPGSIASVTVLKGFAATVIYGSQAQGGAILLKTKMMAERERRDLQNLEAKKVVNKYNDSNLDAPVYNKSYLTQLAQESDVLSAYTLYLNQRKALLDNPTYFVDLFEYFSTKNTRIAKSIGYSVLERHSNNVGALRTLLFKAREKGFYDMELHFAKAIVENYPNRIQSYFDLAMAQKSNGNLQVALDLFLGIADGSIRPDLDFNPILKTANQEIRNLLDDHKDQLEISKTQVTHLEKEALEARIVFDWSNWDSDFEFIFISPSENYTRWKHTMDNPERLKDELEKGYSQEEFEISGGDKGIWRVIVKYLGNRNQKSNVPEYIRCLVQYNYGKENERTEEFIIHLFKEGSEQLAFSLDTLSG
ncbi:MAG: TonB-dependent receptor plug domain-containing protein [Flavobacteriaceae bacterium]|nr:TonB-dependent receptor plug domain-containing protein [Flavobacteriaceae bacterium]